MAYKIQENLKIFLFKKKKCSLYAVEYGKY